MTSYFSFVSILNISTQLNVQSLFFSLAMLIAVLEISIPCTVKPFLLKGILFLPSPQPTSKIFPPLGKKLINFSNTLAGALPQAGFPS